MLIDGGAGINIRNKVKSVCCKKERGEMGLVKGDSLKVLKVHSLKVLKVHTTPHMKNSDDRLSSSNAFSLDLA